MGGGLYSWISGVIGLGLIIGGIYFTGRKVRSTDYRAIRVENEALDSKLAGARRTIDALYAYIHAWRRWVFRNHPEDEIPAELLTVPDDESRD